MAKIAGIALRPKALALTLLCLVVLFYQTIIHKFSIENKKSILSFICSAMK